MNLLKNQQAAEAIDNVYIDLEILLMENIARHLRDWEQTIDTDKWLMLKLAELGQLNKENIRFIAKMSGLAQAEAERMLNELAEETIQSIEPGFQQLVEEGFIDDAVEVPKSKNVKQVMKNLQEQAKEAINLTNTTMLHKAQEAFKMLAINTAEEAMKIMNSNTAAVITGAESRQQALERTITQFAKRGITGFVDKKGRNWTPEAYINMCMRTTAGQVADQIQTARCEDYGINLIEIDAHAGARPKCAKDQGKIFDMNNGSGTTEDLNGRKIKYYPWNSSSYGEPDGILGINCGHHRFPFVPGLNVQRYFPTDDLDANNKLYKQTQVQRALERDIRKQKRECMLQKEVGNEEAYKQAAAKLKDKEAQLRSYVDNHKFLHRRKDRERVVGFDKKLSSEAVGTVRRKSIKLADTTDKWARDARRELLEDERTIANRTKEVAVIYNSKGKFVFTKRGDEKGINFTKAEARRMKECIVSHNHPSGGSFSIPDWIIFKNAQLEELRAVTKNKAYYLRRKNESVLDNWTDEELEYEFRKIRKSVRMKYHKLYEDGIITKSERYLLSTAEYNRLFAEKCGLEYGEESFDER